MHFRVSNKTEKPWALYREQLLSIIFSTRAKYLRLSSIFQMISLKTMANEMVSTFILKFWPHNWAIILDEKKRKNHRALPTFISTNTIC